MTNIALLREAIAYCRAHPDTYDQSSYWFNGKACVIGRAALLSARSFKSPSSHTLDDGTDIFYDWVPSVLGLNNQDRAYIAYHSRTLDEIEARVNEIADRGTPVVAPENVNIIVNDKKFSLAPDQVDAFVKGARAVDPNVRIVKVVIAEVEL